MTQQIIDVGGNTPNNGEGETLRSGAVKINENFSELYGLIGAGGDQTFVNSVTAGTGISVSAAAGDIIITNSAPHVNSFGAITVLGQNTVTAASNQSVALVAGGNITLTTNSGSNEITIAASFTQQQADWTASSGPTFIQHKPTIPAAQIQSDWTQASSGALDFIKNKPTLVTDVSQLTDTTNILVLQDAKSYARDTATIAPSATVVIYSSSTLTTAFGMKALIRVSGPVGGTTEQSEICEMIVTRTVPVSGTPTVAFTIYGTSYTTAALATFSAQWNSLSNVIEITATNLSSTTGEILSAKVIGTELRA